MPRQNDPRVAVRAAREVAHAASYLASEAAGLARLFEQHGAIEASIRASEAAVRAANRAFELDEIGRSSGTESPELHEAISIAKVALDAATDALNSARVAIDAATTAASTGSRKSTGAPSDAA